MKLNFVMSQSSTDMVIACVAWRFLRKLSTLRKRRSRDNKPQSREEPKWLKYSRVKLVTQLASMQPNRQHVKLRTSDYVWPSVAWSRNLLQHCQYSTKISRASSCINPLKFHSCEKTGFNFWCLLHDLKQGMLHTFFSTCSVPYFMNFIFWTGRNFHQY